MVANDDEPERPTPPAPEVVPAADVDHIQQLPDAAQLTVTNWCFRLMEYTGEAPPYDTRICESGLAQELLIAIEGHQEGQPEPDIALNECLVRATNQNALLACRMETTMR